MRTKARVAFAWPGLPHYAARLLRCIAADREISILGTSGPQERSDILRILGQQVCWLEGSRGGVAARSHS